MNPRNNPKADTYILAWRGILHSKKLNRLTMQRELRKNLIIQANELLKGFRK